MPRLVSLSATGRHVVLRTPAGLDIVDALGTAPRVRLATPVTDFACIGSQVWALDGARIDRYRLATGSRAGTLELPAPATALVADHNDGAIAGGALATDTGVVPVDGCAFPLAGRRVATLADGALQIVEGRRVIASLPAPGALSVHALYGGRLLAVRDDDGWTVLRADGTRVHHIAAPPATRLAIAGEAGIALVVDRTHWHWIDLRYGNVRADGETPFAVDDVGVSNDGQHVVFAAAGTDAPLVSHLPAVELLAARRPVAVEVEPVVVDARVHLADEPAPPPPPPEPTVALATLEPHAIGRPLPPLAVAADATWPAYASAREHLDDLLDLVAARVAHALAPDARDQLAAALASTAGRTRSTLAAGAPLPLIELMRELDLSPVAGHVLVVALAPIERGEIAQQLRALVGDHRPLVDRFVLETLVGGDRAGRAAVAAELAPGAPLRRHGLVHVAGESALDAITVDPIIIARLRDRPPTRAVRSLAELWLPAETQCQLVDAVGSAGREPLRLVLRGRRGSGRRSIAAALAARIDRAIAEVDCAQLPRAGAAMAVALQRELAHAVMRGCVPVVSGLELADGGDGEGVDRLRQVMRAHAGPIVIRTAIETSLPLEPGYRTVTLRPPTETERAAFWRTALARAGRTAPDVDTLAARWRLTPGQIETVIADGGADLDAVARQHVATRLAHVATPVRRLASWEHVALADDLVDSIRELIGRIAQRKTVFDDWGFDDKAASARGLTALFYGPPGTGKSMVAGLVARELGLELYRVDLSRVLSKWIGETEKHLAEVFDAAEDGQIVLLFDEADSLFAKRTDVKTSTDRYANLEVNYLLQRLDTFEGIAILTTNLDGSIDPAFKRRMAMRLQFPFPDEDIRKRLWAAHIPASAPTANDFNFDELARRFPLSGGYIRNSALRAAFLAAQERRPLAHEHLLRAIALEYRELGKLAAGGRIE